MSVDAGVGALDIVVESGGSVGDFVGGGVEFVDGGDVFENDVFGKFDLCKKFFGDNATPNKGAEFTVAEKVADSFLRCEDDGLGGGFEMFGIDSPFVNFIVAADGDVGVIVGS